MTWIDQLLDDLAAQPCCGYARPGPIDTEPTALAALALIGHGRRDAAQTSLRWLRELQSGDGSLGIRDGHAAPRWPTSFAVLAWLADPGPDGRFSTPWRRQCVPPAVSWILSLRGEILEEAPHLGHDTTLSAWPWVAGTHSWVEPSALHLLALKAARLGGHTRSREAVRLLIDRQLPRGGCNCGNTFVMGRQLRPHVQPTGLSMLALAGQRDDRGRIDGSLKYLERVLSPQTTAASLAWGVLGLAAHGRSPRQAAAWLQAAHRRASRPGRSPHQDALVALAVLGERSPLIALTRPGPPAEHGDWETDAVAQPASGALTTSRAPSRGEGKT